MRVEHAPFAEVVRQLAEDAGIEIRQAELTPEEARRLRELEQIGRALELAARFYAELLFSSEGAEAAGI